MKNDPRIIVALDVPDYRKAMTLARKLDPELCRLKVGLELFVVTGPRIIKDLHKLGFQIFLDLKFKDIPNTVAGAVRSACKMGVWMLNVHADGDVPMMEAAISAVSNGTLVTGVTVLTSMDIKNLESIGIHDTPPANQVMRLAKLAYRSNLHGVVCSGMEAAALRRQFGPNFLLVTPGIRLPEGNADDQKRIITPEKAIAAGANYLVVGRPIAGAKNPLIMLENFNQRILSIHP